MSAETNIPTVAEREALWTSFVQRWPLEKLPAMTLAEYNQAGDNDHFCRWLEKRTEVLGSIWGGSSLKFGVYSRSSTATKEPTAQSGVSQDGRYGWYSKYGQTAEEAFGKVRSLIVQVATAARAGRLDEVEEIDLWPIIRRKIAFLYQDREHPCILPIFMGRMLRQAWPTGTAPPKDVVALYQGLLAQRGNKPLLAYYDELLSRIPKVDPDRDDVLQHFAAASTLLEALERQGTTAAFVELASALHDKGLDWWITRAELVHAGRTEHPEIWSAAVALRVNVSNGTVGLRAGDSEGEDARPLTLDGVAAWVEQVAEDPRIQAAAHRKPYWPDEYGTGEDRLSVALTEANIRNGQIKVSKLQRLFPAAHFCATTERPVQTFVLDLPDGTRLDEAWVLNDRHRIQPKMGAFMKAQQLRPGDHAVLTKVGPAHYALAFAKQGATPPPLPLPRMAQPLNQILYGPPGTGKTYATIDAALKVLDPDFYDTHRGDSQAHRRALKARFDALARERRVRFVTFHQSFSYEDFVEGIRAHVSDDTHDAASALSYSVERGVFADLCADALRDRENEQGWGVGENPTIWKISLSESNATDGTREFCLANNEARIGWDMVGDLRSADLTDPALRLGANDRASLSYFGREMQIGDVVLCLKTKSTVRAVGVVSGEYEYQPHPPKGVASGYVHKRAVRWLATDLDFNIVALNGGKHLTLPTVYPLKRMEWPGVLSGLRAAGVPFAQRRATASDDAQPYVLVIDEINRGNISRIFGELITLIEPSKRAGAPEALEVVLPYSKKPFSVPGNVYLIGTMNTADRSLTSMDVALRRRFVFNLMAPEPSLLAGVIVEGIPVDELLVVMNQRIEALLDRDHCLGHAYFMPLRDKPELAVLRGIFMNQVLPLLQEYFFDDWQRIQWVLNDHRKPWAYQFVQATDLNTQALFGSEVNVARAPQLWGINHGAFDRVESYLGVIDHQDAQDDE